MSTPVFGRVIEEEAFPEFGQVLESPQTFQEKAIKKGAKVGKAALRGLYKAGKETLKLAPGQMFSPQTFFPKEEAPNKLDKIIQEFLSDPDQGFLEKTVERGAETLPFLLGGGAGIVPKLGRAALSALLGQSVEEAGGEDLSQSAAEILGLGLPGLGKKIIPTKTQQSLLEMLRRRGATEKEIAPLIPSERKAFAFGKLGTKNFRTEKAARNTRTLFGNIYNQVIEEGEKLPILSTRRAQSLKNEIDKSLEKLPNHIRRTIAEDLNDLLKKPIKASDIINFWSDINSQINWKSIGGHKKRLNSLKDPLFDAIREISPDLANDFKLINNHYSKFNKIYKNLKPESLDRWIALGELGALLGSFFKFGPKAAAGVIGTDLVRRLSSEMLINPRLQNLTRQMTTALNANKVGIAKKIQDKMIEQLKKENIDLTNQEKNNLAIPDSSP